MRAIRISRHGGPEVLERVELPEPVPGPGEVLVEVEHVALNHLDLWVRRGVPGHRFPLPLVPGSDIVGRRADTGARVAVQPAYGCMACPSCLGGRQDLCRRYVIRGERGDGGMCQRLAVPEAWLLPVPPHLTGAEAATFPLALLTAWHLLFTRADLRPGQRILVQAGASGVGAFAIQLARGAGARVIATAGSEEKRAFCRELGAELAVPDEEAVDAVRRGPDREGVDLVVDHVGAATWEASLRCLRWGGAYATCGATTGGQVALDLRAVFFKQLAILGGTMGGMAELVQAWSRVQAGAVRPVLDRVLPMSRLHEAHALLEDRAVIGKIVVEQDL